jgi:hypothetical protein
MEHEAALPVLPVEAELPAVPDDRMESRVLDAGEMAFRWKGHSDGSGEGLLSQGPELGQAFIGIVMREAPIPTEVNPAVSAKLGAGIFGIDLCSGVQHAFTHLAL